MTNPKNTSELVIWLVVLIVPAVIGALAYVGRHMLNAQDRRERNSNRAFLSLNATLLTIDRNFHERQAVLCPAVEGKPASEALLQEKIRSDERVEERYTELRDLLETMRKEM